MIVHNGFQHIDRFELRNLVDRAAIEGWSSITFVSTGITHFPGIQLLPGAQRYAIDALIQDDLERIASLKQITALAILGIKIGADGAAILAKLKSLSSLTLWLNQIGDEGARALGTLTGLTSLELASVVLHTD